VRLVIVLAIATAIFWLVQPIYEWAIVALYLAGASFNFVQSRNLRRKGDEEKARLYASSAAILVVFAVVWVLISLL
jgi:4-hydroxybenzoate polyprenyltransferase